MKGVKGVSFNDRELAGRVRSLALDETFKVLSNPKHKLYGPVLTRIVGTILPRLNHLSGEEGGPITISIAGSIAKKNDINTSPR